VKRITLIFIVTAASAAVAPSAMQWRHFDEASAHVSPASLAQRMLQAHNAIRARVGLRSFTWSPELARYAQEWASRLARQDRLYHHPNPVYGENLYLIDGGRTSPSHVVASWASESRWFNYKTNSCRGTCGHYTQIVWRDSREIGCASAISGKTQVWVCEYNPPGNIVGERPY
jgi:uncharacterized protein YkwD